MCIDYTSLNKACPKDPFPLPRIDQIMDSTCGCDLLCFLDAYSGFHQIPLSREDEEHTTFITIDGLFCYTSMPYGLKNDLPTFLRAMLKAFGNLIRDILEVYVDDIVVKIKSLASLFRDTTEKLFGFLVLHWGIEANPERIKTIKAMWPPALIKDVQKLMGCLAMLSVGGP
jgi:hypothetical protein